VDIYESNEGFKVLRDALLSLKKRNVSSEELEATKKICKSNLAFITNIMLDYCSTPDDCINMLNRSQKIKREIDEI